MKFYIRYAKWYKFLVAVCLFLWIFSALPLACDDLDLENDGTLKVGLFLDAGTADVLVSDHLYLRGGLSLQMVPELSIDLPVTLVCNRERDAGSDYMALDLGMLLKYYPGNLGFWAGVTLFQGVNFLGETMPEEQYHYMTEIAVGYTLKFPGGLYIEPCLILRDPLMTFNDSLDYIGGYIPAYGDYRICVQVGWMLWEAG